MDEVILLKDGEIALKGLNRKGFEARLEKNAMNSIADLGGFSFFRAQSTTVVTPDSKDCDLDEAVARLSKVFGFASLARACVVEKDFERIKSASVHYLTKILSNTNTFKVRAKRSDKAFPMDSNEICVELGAFLLDEFPHLKVDVHDPQITVTVEIRDKNAFIHAERLKGAGGVPVGTGGDGTLLISGGIDSPVAGYMMAKRGMTLHPIHFESPPYTSEQAKRKVVTLLEKLSLYTGGMNLALVPFTRLQEELRKNAPDEYFTILMRRLMMRIAGAAAAERGCSALITGESLGQVASQTADGIFCTDAAVIMPVFRPLIGMDKEEIVKIARQIGTYETSILPYEDCCTVFTPKHPKTKPKLEKVLEIEAVLGLDELLNETISNITYIPIGVDGQM